MLKRKLIDLSAQRQTALNKAQDAALAGMQADYDSAMAEVANLNTEIDRVQNLIREQERNVITEAPTAAEARDMAEERAARLRKGDSVTFSAGLSAFSAHLAYSFSSRSASRVSSSRRSSQESGSNAAAAAVAISAAETAATILKKPRLPSSSRRAQRRRSPSACARAAPRRQA